MIPFSLIIVQSNSNGLGFYDISKTEQRVLLQPFSWLNGWVFSAALKASLDLIDSDQEAQAEKNAFQRLWDSFTISLAQLRSHSRSSRNKCWVREGEEQLEGRQTGILLYRRKSWSSWSWWRRNPDLILSCGTWSADLSVPTSPTRCKIEKEKKKKTSHVLETGWKQNKVHIGNYSSSWRRCIIFVLFLICMLSCTNFFPTHGKGSLHSGGGDSCLEAGNHLDPCLTALTKQI